MAVRGAIDRRSFALSGTQAFAVLAVLGLVVRLALLRTPFHGYDAFAYSHWTWRLVHQPLGGFYVDDGQVFPDHLPGDLWFLKIIGQMTNTVDPTMSFYTPTYTMIIACVVTVFDAVTAITIWRVGIRFGSGENASRYASAYWLAPAPIFVASVWGQTDGISAALAVIALGLGVAQRFSLSVLVLTFCVLVKPQYGLLLLPLLLGWWRTDTHHWRTRLTHIAWTGFGCLALVAVLAAPFRVSLVGEWGDWSMIQRVQLANDLYPVSTLGAHNLWIVSDPFNWPPDDRASWLLGMSRHTIGLLMFATILVTVSWILLRRWRGVVTIVLTSNILMLGFFLVMTRMHERYAFPVVALSILLAAMDTRYRLYAVTINLLVFANIALRYAWIGNGQDMLARVLNSSWVESTFTVYILVAITVWSYGWLLAEASRKTPKIALDKVT
ncbi:MAG: hypothetical protein M9934_07975 [Thermomicrobiales bacterium]|nr:hypothetical protein [Thermomicrobiales bacterium]